jgi:hypothetical protein
MSTLQKNKSNTERGDDHVSSDAHNTIFYNFYILTHSMDENTVTCRELLRDL